MVSDHPSSFSPLSSSSSSSSSTSTGCGSHPHHQIPHSNMAVVNVNLNNMMNAKDSRWLQLEVCREFQRSKCSRSDTECKFAHPPANVEVQNGRVIACYDSIKVRTIPNLLLLLLLPCPVVTRKKKVKSPMQSDGGVFELIANCEEPVKVPFCTATVCCVCVCCVLCLPRAEKLIKKRCLDCWSR